jgi:hypothetical protein
MAIEHLKRQGDQIKASCGTEDAEAMTKPFGIDGMTDFGTPLEARHYTCYVLCTATRV